MSDPDGKRGDGLVEGLLLVVAVACPASQVWAIWRRP